MEKSAKNLKMDGKTLKKKFAVSAITTMLIVCSLTVLVQAQSTQGQLGKDLASNIREIVQTHKADIQDFILEVKVDGAETGEAKLAIVEGYVAELRAKIDENKAARDEILAGDLTGEEFAMEMKGLALELAEFAKTMGTLGEELGELGQSTASEIRESAAAQVPELQGLAGEIAEIGISIAEEMTEKDLPVADIPEVPDIPELPDVPQIPDVPVPPTLP